MLVTTALFMFTSLVASSLVMIEDRKTSINTVSKSSSKFPTSTMSKSSTVLADLTEKVLHWADRLEQGEKLKPLKEDWRPHNHTVLGPLLMLGPLLKNYIDLVPSVSACTGALLGFASFFF